MDVLDLHFQFRFSLHHRMKDGVHWNAVAHRKITSLLLQHAAEAWGVILPCPVTVYGERKSGVTRTCRKIFCTSRIKCGLLVSKLPAGFELHLFSPFFLGVDHTEVAEEQPTYNSAPKHTSKTFMQTLQRPWTQTYCLQSLDNDHSITENLVVRSNSKLKPRWHVCGYFSGRGFLPLSHKRLKRHCHHQKNNFCIYVWAS